jgi:DNA anti-recombination protein RmuC
MALTRTVGHIWRQDALAANAQEVQALGRELAERLATMLGHLDKLGSALGSGVSAYNQAIASLESRVLVTGRRFTEMQGLPVPLDPPRQVDQQPRSLAARPSTTSLPSATSLPSTTAGTLALAAPQAPAAPQVLDALEQRALDAGELPRDTPSAAVG